jgi:large subunit ribosomal protein L22
MATANAKLKNLPVSPRKTRLVADLIRGKKVAQARDILRFTVKGCALPLRKLLESAAANADSAAAERHERVDTDEMVVKNIMVGDGRTLRRFVSGPRGRAMRIRKRSCHVELTISDK